jgi:hypothetical protein
VRKISIHQPNYIPWLGYFYKIYKSDCFVFLDDAQFSNEGMHNYHYIKTQKGSFRLRIPVSQTLGDRIEDVTTKDEMGWKEKHIRILESNYKKAPHLREVITDFAEILFRPYSSLSEMNTFIIKYICTRFGIISEFVNSSSLGITTTRQEKILDICDMLRAEIYYSGTGAKAYQDESDFIKRGIKLKYLEYRPFSYRQLWEGFQSNVTVIDYIMNYGYDWETVIKNQIPD